MGYYDKGPFLVLSGSTNGGGITGSDIYLMHQKGFSAQVFYSASMTSSVPTGSLTLEVANFPPSGSIWRSVAFTGKPRSVLWTPEGSTTAGNVALTGSATNTAPKFYNITDAQYERARFVYNATTNGTGSIEVWVMIKE